MNFTILKLQISYKKISVLWLSIAIGLLPTFFFADAQKTLKNHSYSSGRDRVFTIMYDGNHGITSYNKNITYAETENLVEDVAIPQVALYFAAQTDIGQTFLVDTLSHPISPKDKNNIIQLRQNVIQNLVTNSTLYQEITELLIQAKDAELSVMELMVNRNKALEAIKIPEDAWEVSKPWYAITKYIAQNPWINLINQVKDVFKTTAIAGITATQLQMAYNEYNNPNFQWADPKRQQILREILDLKANNSQDNKSYWQAGQDKYKNYLSLGDQGVLSDEGYRTIQLILGGIAGSSFTYDSAQSIYTEYEKGLKNRNLIHALHTFVIVAEKVEALCKNYGIQTQFTITSITDSKGFAMIQGLKHPRYHDKESSMVLTPWVNTFINEIYEQDIYLAPIFGLIAEVDAYHAIATKMITSKIFSNQFCFSQALQQSKPKFAAQDFWNIVVAHPVTNSLTESRNIILTGSNAGGKSTAIRSILQNIIFSQTFGFATGTQFESTHYEAIHSYLTISDDITKGLSRYASELKQANDIVIRSKALQHNEKFFFVLDELFTGTGGREGEIAAYEFINDDLAPFLHQIQFIFATHFDKLKEIEKNNPKYFANYKIDVPIINNQGILEYPFTLSKGASNTNIAMLMKKQAGLLGKTSSLLGNAQAA